jgi:hypothetical protein
MLLCTACASPSSQEATKFGSAATSALTIITDSRTAQIDLIRESQIEVRACNYLNHGVVDLYPPLDGKGPKLIEEQISLLTAITDYAKALSVATDPQAISDLEAAAAKLPTASSSLLASVPNTGSSPLIGPAITLVSTVAVDVVELETRARLRSVIEATRGPLDVAVLQLMEDSVKVQNILDNAYQQWASAKKCNLDNLYQSNIAANGRPYLYSAYKDADSVARGFRQRLSVLNPNKLAAALTALEETHAALLSNDVDFQAAYQKLKDIVSQLQAINSAAAPAKPAT